MKVGILFSRLRTDEKLLIDAIEANGHQVVLLDDREIFFSLEKIDKKTFGVDIILERCSSHGRATYSLEIFNTFSIPTINTFAAAQICGSKFLTTEALLKADIPTPRSLVAFNRTQALKAIETIGYPVIMKPAVGSWGTLLAKVNDIDAAQAILAHKKVLGSFHHAIYYIQEYIDKPGRDIRAFVVGDEVVGAIYRYADFWITHLDHGARFETCPVTPEIAALALRAAKAVGGDFVAIDIAEDKLGKMYVLEVDYTVEFTKAFPFISEDIVQKVVTLLEKKVG